MGDLRFAVTDFPSGNDVLNPFENARNLVMQGIPESIGKFVQGQIDDISMYASTSFIAANEAIEALKNHSFQRPDTPIQIPDLDFDFDYDFTIEPVDPQDLGDISGIVLPATPQFTGAIALTPPDIPDFNPSITTLIIPEAPPFTLGPAPVNEFEITDPTFPDAPNQQAPATPQLLALNLPAVPNVVIPTFDTTFPDFDFPAPPTGIEWSEPEYSRVIIDDVLTAIQDLLNGGTGLRPDIETAISERAGEREDRIAHQAVSEVTDEFAGRGFTAPPGMMNKRIDSIRAERDLKKQGLSREVAIRAMDIEIENKRYAIAQGIAAEEIFVRLHLAMVDRMFQVARLAVELGIQVYTLQITLFQAQLDAIRVEVVAYEAQVRGALAVIELYKALIDAETAKAEINQALVEQYKAQVEVLQIFVNKYAVEVQAEATKMEAQAIRIRAFGEEVNAYRASVDAERAKFDAYDSRIKGEIGKASIVEAESRAYAAQVQAIATGSNAEARAYEAQVTKFTGDIQAYSATIDGRKAQVDAQLAYIERNLAAYRASIEEFAARASLEEGKARVEVAAWEAGLRNQVEFYRTQVAEWEAELRAVIEEARLQLSALETAGQLAATINAGALAAMHVGATLSGSGSVSAGGNLSESYSTSKSANVDQSESESISQNVTYRIEEQSERELPPGEPPWGDPDLTN